MGIKKTLDIIIDNSFNCEIKVLRPFIIVMICVLLFGYIIIDYIFNIEE
jgi:hypothetical protein